jgi:hypothetical protein
MKVRDLIKTIDTIRQLEEDVAEAERALEHGGNNAWVMEAKRDTLEHYKERLEQELDEDFI